MPRYYFDVRDHEGLHRDEFGDEFADFEEARCQVQAIVTGIAAKEVPDEEGRTVMCELRDESGRFVYRGEVIYRGTREPN